jgi:hypothetical protein
MGLTRAAAEAILVGRCGKILALAGLDGTTVDGTNPDLADPIRSGLASLGLATATVGAVVDADLAAIASETLDQLLDVAEVRALESALGNLDQPDQEASLNNYQYLGRLRDSIEKTVARKRTQAVQKYNFGQGAVSSGTVAINA